MYAGMNSRVHPSKIATGETPILSGFFNNPDGKLIRRDGFSTTANRTSATSVCMFGLDLFRERGQADGYLVAVCSDGKSRRGDA